MTTPNGKGPDDRILEDAYDEMRALARRRLSQMGSQSLQATELVNETWLRLMGQNRGWDNRSELFGLAARAMRDILVDRARAKSAHKRGGDWQRVNWETALAVATEHPEELLMLDEAVSRLSDQAPDHARVVEMMFFAGLTGDETARALDVSPSTVDRRWRFARAWLHRELTES
ncbi:RNA polymerase subunit sigma [bacterium]|nr:MAG: RNA polymerase subunit sigma [bacterium]